MNLMNKLSIAITTHNDRVESVKNIACSLHNDNRVEEIIIVDDASGEFIKQKLQLSLLEYPKVKLYFNKQRQFVNINKYTAVKMCKCDFVALLDSDNIFNASYIDAWERAVEKHGAHEIYAPEKALPRFDFSRFTGKVIDRCTVSRYMDDPLFCVAMNTGNYIVHTVDYLDIVGKLINEQQQEPAPNCCDVIYQNYHMFKEGCSLIICEDMQYGHPDTPDSTYRAWINKEPTATKYWQDRMKRL